MNSAHAFESFLSIEREGLLRVGRKNMVKGGIAGFSLPDFLRAGNESALVGDCLFQKSSMIWGFFSSAKFPAPATPVEGDTRRNGL